MVPSNAGEIELEHPGGKPLSGLLLEPGSHCDDRPRRWWRGDRGGELSGDDGGLGGSGGFRGPVLGPRPPAIDAS